MEIALHVIKLSQHEDFDVQTSLFSNRIITAIFSKTDRIPMVIATTIQNRLASCSEDLLGVGHPSIDGFYRPSTGDYSETECAGFSVETYAFQDAEYVHNMISEIVAEFLNTHTRTVTYVPK